MPKVQKGLKQCRFPGCNYTNKYPYGIKNHERVHYPELERPYGCNLCKFRARSQAGLKRHLIVHSQETPYMCSVVGCEYKTKHRGCFRNHEKMVHSSAVDEACCSIEGCTFKTKHVHNLQRHIMSRHRKTRVKTVPCPMCSRSFFTILQMRAHLQSHTNEKPWRCSVCNFETKKKQTLARHEDACKNGSSFRRSNDTSFYKCAHCDFSTRFRSGLDRHLPSHSQDRPYACTVPGCSFRAKRADTLKIHMAAHRSNQYPCSVAGCTYLAKNAGVLGYHHLKKHSFPFPCVFPDCKERFSTEVALIIHQRFHQPDRPHRCDSCLRRFKKLFQLNKHILHSHEKPQRFQCALCDYSTSNRCTRKTHMKKVHRMKDVICDEPGCSFRSCSAEDLHHHRMTRHNVSRAFKCEHCCNRFGCSSNLTAHLRQKHGDLFELHFSKGKGSKRYCCENSDRAFDSQVSILKHYATQKVAIVMLSRTEVHFL